MSLSSDVSVSTHTTSSSFTWKRIAQRPGQLMAQWPQVTFSSDSASAGSVALNRFAPVAAAPPTAARAPSAPVDLTNVRRFMHGMSCIASPFFFICAPCYAQLPAATGATSFRTMRFAIVRRADPRDSSFPGADLLGKQYRARFPTVSHKTCELCVSPRQMASHTPTCDILRTAARYTVLERFSPHARASPLYAHHICTPPTTPATRRRLPATAH